MYNVISFVCFRVGGVTFMYKRNIFVVTPKFGDSEKK